MENQKLESLSSLNTQEVSALDIASSGTESTTALNSTASTIFKQDPTVQQSLLSEKIYNMNAHRKNSRGSYMIENFGRTK